MNSIRLKTVFGSETVIFNLRILSVAEENKFRASTFGLKEAEKEAKEFDQIISALSESEYTSDSVTHAIERITPDDNGEHLTELMSVSEYFRERTASKERIAHVAFRSYLLALQPTADFL